MPSIFDKKCCVILKVRFRGEKSNEKYAKHTKNSFDNERSLDSYFFQDGYRTSSNSFRGNNFLF